MHVCETRRGIAYRVGRLDQVPSDCYFNSDLKSTPSVLSQSCLFTRECVSLSFPCLNGASSPWQGLPHQAEKKFPLLLRLQRWTLLCAIFPPVCTRGLPLWKYCVSRFGSLFIFSWLFLIGYKATEEKGKS